MIKKALIVDDDRKLQEALKEYLEEDEFKVTSLYDGLECLDAIAAELPDIVILDIMLPGCSGLDVMRKIKEKYNLPVLLLTAKGDETDRIVGLELGADDYLPKPFNPRELVARIRAVMRRNYLDSGDRSKASDEMLVISDNLVLNKAKQCVNVDGEEVELTLTEYKILEVMVRNRNIILSRDRLMNLAMGKDFMAFDRAIDVHVSKLRAKLGTGDEASSYIKTVRGTGYMLVAKT
jgi:DNA-binding response OmpR family regulator